VRTPGTVKFIPCWTVAVYFSMLPHLLCLHGCANHIAAVIIHLSTCVL